MRWAPISGGIVNNLPVGFDEPSLIAVDSQFVYFSSSGGKLERISKSGGFPQTLHFGNMNDLITELLVDPTHLVWLVDLDSTFQKQIWKMVK